MLAEAKQRPRGAGIEGRTVFIPQMSRAGARLMAAAFRSIGVDAAPAPDSDALTLELGGLYSSGEECLPHKVTLGDFLKVCRAPGFDASRTAFLMPTAHGPCRFGQYGPYLRKTLDGLGLGDVPVVSPSADNGYDGFGDHAGDLMRTGWMAIVLGDLLTRFLLKTRPYEITAGDADQGFEQSLASLCRIVEQRDVKTTHRLARLAAGVERMRDAFRAVPARYEKGRPLIGLVGEIFCRLNTFSNDDLARRIEKHGGECWISDISEWVWYSNWGQGNRIRAQRRRFSADNLKFKLKTHVQHRYERTLLTPAAEDLRGYEEPDDVAKVLAASHPYLPAEGCLGEMVLSVGKAIHLHRKGADGVIDISPFTCMNGIVCEAVYPAVSRDCDALPIRMFYFDGINTNVDRDIEIFLDLARAYQARKTRPRTYPFYFN